MVPGPGFAGVGAVLTPGASRHVSQRGVDLLTLQQRGVGEDESGYCELPDSAAAALITSNSSSAKPARLPAASCHALDNNGHLKLVPD
ncbi:hypothetical protein KIL84_008197 [Mauremys mutica]|uniref:Uncharacterized protein n=1 Tax=Mauremys mutica TaxID=74926 RepID=A0A9D3X976_9SAUR|nr:hypothetical protein KIL84_008197 [Mauremys mutica]